MNRRKINILMICRAGIIAALYVVLTLPFGGMAYGPIQIRPSEGLAALTLIYPESILGVYIGCMLSNIISAYGIYDVLLGGLATLISGIVAYLLSRVIKNKVAAVILCILPVVIINSFVVPAVWLLAGGEVVYLTEAAIMLLNESIWAYGVGVPLYFIMKRLIASGAKGVTAYGLSGKIMK